MNAGELLDYDIVAVVALTHDQRIVNTANKRATATRTGPPAIVSSAR